MPDLAPPKEDMLAEAYKRGLMPAERKTAYEEAVKRRAVKAPSDVLALVDARQEQGKGGIPAVDRVVRGMTAGFSDEIAGGLKAARVGVMDAFGQSPGYSPGEAYSATKTALTESDKSFSDAHPVAAPALEITGALAPTKLAGMGAKAAGIGLTGVKGAAVGGAAIGAATGAGNSDGGIIPRAKNALGGGLIGGVTGGTLQYAGSAMTKAASAAAASPTAQRLLSRAGVILTPGQMAGGLIKNVEDLAQRAPILGPAISAARQRGNESLNRAVANRTLEPLGLTVPGSVAAGHDTFAYVEGQISKAYGDAASKIVSATPDQPFLQGMASVSGRRADLPPPMADQFDAIVRNRVLSQLKGPLTGAKLKEMQSQISKLSSDYGSSSDGAQRIMGDMLGEVSNQIKGLMGRSSPEAKIILDKADAAWANLVRMRNAASKADDGVFTPGQLKSAVRTSDRSVGKGAVARGDALMQDLSGAASKVMPDKFGNPGTANAIGLGAGVTGLFTHPVATAGAAAGLTAGAGVYSRLAQTWINDVYRSSSPGQARAALGQLELLAAKYPVLVPQLEAAREHLMTSTGGRPKESQSRGIATRP